MSGLLKGPQAQSRVRGFFEQSGDRTFSLEAIVRSSHPGAGVAAETGVKENRRQEPMSGAL